MARSDATAFVVEVLDGPSSGLVVELVGRELPYRTSDGGSISFGREQRTNLVWYPGNPDATQQVLGRTLEPLTINGVWDERYLGEDRPIELVEIFEGISDQGAEVRVNWSTREYYGVVKAVRWQPGAKTGGLHTIAWTIVFEWNREGESFVTPVGSSQISRRDAMSSGAEGLSSLCDSTAAILQARSVEIGAINARFEGAKRVLEEILGEAEPVIDSEARAASDASYTTFLDESVAAAASSGQSIASEIADVVASFFTGAVTNSDDVDVVLIEYLERSEIVDTALEEAEKQYELRVLVESAKRPVEFVRVPAVQGVDLRTISLKYYGTADHWQRLAKQNGIEGSLIPFGLDELIVPINLPDETDPLRSRT